MIVCYPAKPGEPIDRELALDCLSGILISFAESTDKPGIKIIKSIDYRFLSYNSVESYRANIKNLSRFLEDKAVFRNYYNDEGKLAFITAVNFHKFLPPDLSAWTYVDDHSELFEGNLN